MKRLVRKFNKLPVYMLALIMMVTIINPAVVSRAAKIDDEVSTSDSILDYNEYYYDSEEEAKEVFEASGSTISDSGEAVESENGVLDDSGDMPGAAITCGSIADAGKYVRDHMTTRSDVISLRYENKESSDAKTIYYAIRDEAFKETGVPTQGDYLMWNWQGANVRYEIEADGSISFQLRMLYLSTAAQEKQIDAEVNRLLNNEFKGWENMHDYEKVKMVYRWMTMNMQYIEGANNHSTYSALINHKTVCQGIATGIYRLLGEMGVNTRLIASDDHGWNIVQLGRYWYSLDATWDLGYPEEAWNFFLPDEYLFVNLYQHYRASEYNTPEFNAEYPMGSTAYNYEKEKDEIGVYYRTHVQSYGWQRYKYDGATSGTTKEAKRLEAIDLKLKNTGSYELGIEYQTHIQSYGWETGWKSNGAMSGTSGESKRLEAIRIRLTGADASKFDVYYRVHAQSYGWLGWAMNGAEAGTAGQGKRLESIQVLVLPKGKKPDGMIGNAYKDYGREATSQILNPGMVNYTTHVQSYGWQGYASDGCVSGTSGEAKRLEGIEIILGDTGYEGGIRYTTHVQSYGWQGDKNNAETWKKDGEVAGTSGEAKRLEGICIQLYGEVAEHYDVYYRVHAQSYGWLGWACNGACAGTSGLAKRLEAIQIVLLPKGSEAPEGGPTPFVSK